MMIEKLTKVEGGFFDEYYTGECGSKRVVCILDNNCVRYMGFVYGKRVTRREYGNTEKSKATCMARALEWLNK